MGRKLLRVYESTGQAKIVLQCPTLDELKALEARARSEGLPTYLVADAGRTQIAAGSRTVLAIGPGPRSRIDTVAGHLKLL